MKKILQLLNLNFQNSRMPWIEIEIRTSNINDRDSRSRIWKCRDWCAHNLSSNGVLWKHQMSTEKWNVFYFAQPGDATMFRLVNGV